MLEIILTDTEKALIQIPKELELSDLALSQIKLGITDAEENLEICKTNAALSAPDASNDTKRKMLRDQAIAQSAECITASNAIRGLKIQYAEREATNARLRREFAAACHLAELKSAQFNLMAKGHFNHE